ncbi:MAG: hypothetical protein ACO2O2_15215 [Acidilobaceae archaeon]
MRLLKVSTLVILILLALTMEPLEAKQNPTLNPTLNIESKNSVVVKGNWSTTLTGVVELSKTVNVSDGRVEVEGRVYARIADSNRGLNFTLHVEYNMSIVLAGNKTESSTKFKINYEDYGALARLSPTGRLALEALGSTSTTVADGRLNSTLKSTIKPSTGNRIYDVVVAGFIAYLLNETLNSLKEELLKLNATLEYEVTLIQRGATVELKVKATIPLGEKAGTTKLKPPTGIFKVKASLEVDRSQAKASIELEALTGSVNPGEALNTIRSLASTRPYGLEETLDKADRLLESLNNLITTLNTTLAAINMQQGGMIVQEAPLGGSTVTTMVEEAGAPVREGRSGTTLTLLLMGLIAILALATSYMILTGRKT